MKTIKRIQAAVILFAIAFSTHQGDAQTNLAFVTNGLVAYYPLRGSAIDASGNGNGGTAYNVVFGPDRFGNPVGAAIFSPSDLSSISIPASFPSGTSPLSVSFWTELQNVPSSAGAGEYPVFGVQGTNGSSWNFNFFVEGTIITPETEAFSPAYEAGYSVASLFPSLNSATQQWHHIAMTFSDALHYSLYLDGAPITLTGFPITNNYVRPPGAWAIGTSPPSEGGRYFSGALNDFRIYNRALSAVEITKLYSYESGAEQISIGFILP